RAEVLWIAFAAVMTPVGFLALYLVPLLLGYEALASRTWTTTLLVIGFLLLAAGVPRLKILSLERHVGAVYQWTLVPIGFIALDAVLVYLLNINLTTSTVIMAVLLLFVYLPLRQWLWGRLTRLRMKDYEGVFGEAADALVEGALRGRSPENVWRDLLNGVFRPLTLEQIQGGSETGLAERGQSLRVAANEFADGYLLQYADQGSRIFTEDDVDLLNSLQRLFVRMFDYRDGVARGQLLERERIRRDLHDQVGSKLLSLVYRSTDPESKRLASDTIHLLGAIMTAIKQEPVSVSQLAGELRSICVESSWAAGLQCVVEDQLEEGIREIPSFYYLNILSMLRELINNTAKHAGAQNVRLRVLVDDRGIHLEYRDDGRGFDLETVSRGNGLYNIQSRAEEMHAELHWETLAQTRVNLSIPLENMAGSAT
ncbi:MAG: hypothetical protein O3B72_09005, partial [Proteobacteria bacterium]|nr:hypothetical protein [Pseudomonadota bacterium]